MIRRLVAAARRDSAGQRLVNAAALERITIDEAEHRILNPPRQPGIGAPGRSFDDHVREIGRSARVDP